MKPRILVLGCGGVGGIVAARLSAAGYEVTPVTGNPEITEALQRRGYLVQETDGRTWQIAPTAPPLTSLRERPAGAPPFDLCLSITKATTLSTSLQEALPHLAPQAPVLCFQNGLPEPIAADIIGPRRVLGCVVGFGASLRGPGSYEQTSPGGLQIGRHDPSGPDLASIADLLQPALATRTVDDLAGVRWSKLAINCATSTLGLLGGVGLWPLLQRRFVRRLVLEIWSEVVAVAKKKGVRLALVGGTLDIAKLALTPSERFASLGSAGLTWKHSVLLAVGVKFRKMRSSMLLAWERKRTPEIDFLNGEIVRQGEALGVATPVNARLVREVRAVFAGEKRPSLEDLRTLHAELIPAARAHALATAPR